MSPEQICLALVVSIAVVEGLHAIRYYIRG